MEKVLGQPAIFLCAHRGCMTAASSSAPHRARDDFDVGCVESCSTPTKVVFDVESVESCSASTKGKRLRKQTGFLNNYHKTFLYYLEWIYAIDKVMWKICFYWSIMLNPCFICAIVTCLFSNKSSFYKTCHSRGFSSRFPFFLIFQVASEFGMFCLCKNLVWAVFGDNGRTVNLIEESRLLSSHLLSGDGG